METKETREIVQKGTYGETFKYKKYVETERDWRRL